MVYRRRPRRTTRRRKSSFKRKRSSKYGRGAHSKVVRFTRETGQSVISSDAGGLVNYYPEYALSNIPDYSEFVNLFESYKIDKIVLRWTPINPNVAGANTVIGNLGSLLDYNDASAISTYNVGMEYSTSRRHRYDKGWTRSFTPHPLQMLWVSGIATGYTSFYGKLNTAYATMPHYGFKLFGDGLPASTALGTLSGRFYCSFRDYK